MNEQYFYEEFFMMYLYKVKKIDTNSMEPMFNRIDPQLTNNVISNRGHSTSPIYKGFLDYDEDKHTLKITKQGISYIRKNFLAAIKHDTQDNFSSITGFSAFRPYGLRGWGEEGVRA